MAKEDKNPKHTSVHTILALRRLRQEEDCHESEASLSYIVRQSIPVPQHTQSN